MIDHPVRTVRGLTLMELLVALVVIGILAAIAIPNYAAYVTRSKRAAAKTALLEAAQFLERNYTASGCYDRASTADCVARSGAALALPFDRAPSEGRASYALTVTFATPQQFELRATPCATAGTCPAGSDPFSDLECGEFTLTQTGARGVRIGGTPSADTALINRCWER